MFLVKRTPFNCK